MLPGNVGGQGTKSWPTLLAHVQQVAVSCVAHALSLALTQQLDVLQVGIHPNQLRPEIVESFFYLWRVTRDERYRDWGWRALQAFEEHCRTEDSGYAGIEDVDVVPPTKDNTQQSFWLAETLKYLALLFSPEDELPLDQWVLNTEAHPIRPMAPLTYAKGYPLRRQASQDAVA